MEDSKNGFAAVDTARDRVLASKPPESNLVHVDRVQTMANFVNANRAFVNAENNDPTPSPEGVSLVSNESPSLEKENNPSLSDILRGANRQGGEQLGVAAEAVMKKGAEAKVGFLNQANAARERARAAWDKAKDLSKKYGKYALYAAAAPIALPIVGAVVGGSLAWEGAKTGIGLATNEELRKQLGEYVGTKAENARESVTEKYREISEKFVQLKDRAFNSFKERVFGILNKGREVMKPVVDGGKAVAERLVHGAGVAAEVAQNVPSYFKTHVDNTVHEIRAGIVETSNIWHDIISKPDALRAELSIKFMEHLAEVGARSYTRVESHQNQKLENDAHAAEIRAKKKTPSLRNSVAAQG